MSLVSSIYGRYSEPMTEAQKDEAARELWRSGGDWIAVRLSEIRDDFERQALINVATRLYGARKRGHK